MRVPTRPRDRLPEAGLQLPRCSPSSCFADDVCASRPVTAEPNKKRLSFNFCIGSTVSAKRCGHVRLCLVDISLYYCHVCVEHSVVCVSAMALRSSSQRGERMRCSSVKHYVAADVRKYAHRIGGDAWDEAGSIELNHKQHDTMHNLARL
jgi:hypothetical protein